MDEKKIPVPNTVGELIEFLKQFPENTILDVYKTEGYYDRSESDVRGMSYVYYEGIANVSLTFD